MLAHAHAGGRDQQISSRRTAQVPAQAFLAVARDPEIDGFRASAPNQGVERVRVRARDLGTRENRVALLELDDLIARSHERDPRPAMHQRRVVGNRGQHAELRGTERRAGGQHDRALANVLATAPDVLFRVARIADRDMGLGRLRGVFLTDHGVGALREGRAGEDAGRLRLTNRLAGKLAGGDGLDDGEVGLGLLEIRTAYRIAVHRGVVPGRQIDRTRDVFGENCVERLAQRPARGRKRLDVREDYPGGLCRRHGGSIFARSHARLAIVTSQAVSLNRKTGKGMRRSRSSVTIATQSPGSWTAGSKIGFGPATARYTSILGRGARLNPSTSTISAPPR